MNRVEQLKQVQDEALELFERKNADYGDAFATYGPVGVLMRIGYKIQRMVSVRTQGGTTRRRRVPSRHPDGPPQLLGDGCDADGRGSIPTKNVTMSDYTLINLLGTAVAVLFLGGVVVTGIHMWRCYQRSKFMLPLTPAPSKEMREMARRAVAERGKPMTEEQFRGLIRFVVDDEFENPLERFTAERQDPHPPKE